MDKIKNQLAGVAALLGVIAAIGGGFVKYGEITTKLDALASQQSADYSAQIAVLEEKVTALEASNNGDVDTALTALDKRSAINQKQIQLLQNQIDELKAKSDNPLAQ